MVATPGLPGRHAADGTCRHQHWPDRPLAARSLEAACQGQAVTREQLVEAAILLRGAELHDFGLLLGGVPVAQAQRMANRDPLGWTMRLVELHRLVHLARCLPLLAIVAGLVPEEL